MSNLAVYSQVSEMVSYSPEEIQVIHDNVAKNTTPTELAYFLEVCKSVDLNPFNKEIWCYKDYRENLVMFTGRDGFLAMAQKNKAFNGIRSCEIYEKDVFDIDVANNVINHKTSFGDRGKIVGAFAIVFRKDGEPTIELAEFETYYKGLKKNGQQIQSSPWNTAPAEMIKKVAESHALKKAFGLNGVASEYDFDTTSGMAVPVGEIVEEKALITSDMMRRLVEICEECPEVRADIEKRFGPDWEIPDSKAKVVLKWAEEKCASSK